MTLKHFLNSIQDSKIQAEIVVSDLGRMHPIQEIQADKNVVVLICRPRPDWEAEAQRRKLAAEQRRISAQSGEWERQEIEAAYQSINRHHRSKGVYSEPGPTHSDAWMKQLGEEDKIKAEAFAAAKKP